MKHIRSKIAFTTMSIMTVSGILISCTKSVPYDSVYKGTGKTKVQEKTAIDTNAEYLFVSSTDLSNHDSAGIAGATPYWQGDEKIVKFRFTEDALQVVQVNEEERLRDNRTNDKVLMEIPVSHVDYRCVEDRYKKCTNKEEENNELAWNQKSKFLPKFDSMKTTGFSMLPLDAASAFGSDCFTETASQFIGYEMTADSMNIQVQKTFRGDLKCLASRGNRLSSLNSLDDLQSQVIYHYSFSKLNSVVSKGYKAVDYPRTDENDIGFFTTEPRKFDVDYTYTESKFKQYMNRWNPERTVVDYYLTDNFNKPEFASIKKATYEAFEQTNAGLAAAGVKFRLKLHEPDHKAPGDLRNSMIVLVEDPVAAGPLGYGPTVTNPRTGEIISGRVAMYYGNYMTSVSYFYDEVVRELRREAAEASKKASGATVSKADKNSLKVSDSVAYQTKIGDYLRRNSSQKLGNTLASIYMKHDKQAALKTQSFANDSRVATKPLAKMTAKEWEKATLVKSTVSRQDDVLATMSKYCAYPSELFPFNEIIRGALKANMGKLDLRPWKDLTGAEKKAVIDVLMPETWRPTLIHELGHNLGLRHNFGGSEDKENFYTKAELQKMGVNHEVPYSSVMDYGYGELNLLPTLGKYDIAALKFGYLRQVEGKDGKPVAVETTLEALKKTNSEIKDFKYCSDEHVDVNPNCKRFDKGTNMSEIVDYLIQNYDDMYRLRNLRNDRESFSKMSDAAAFYGALSRFEYIRAFMERYESVKARFGIGDDAKEWEEIPFLKDLKTAALKSGQFFIKVINTPDVYCVVAEKKDLNKIAGIQRLDQLSGGEGVSCFKDAKLKEDYVVVGQFGKSFNDRKDPDSTNSYADQIDVRGIWVDKIAAAHMLFARQIGNSIYDKVEDNYLDIPELAKDVLGMMAGMLYDQVETPVTVFDKDGVVIMDQEPFRHSVLSDPKSLHGEGPTNHWIETPLSEGVARSIGVPMRRTSYQEILMNIAAKHMRNNQSRRTESEATLNGVSVVKTSQAFQVTDKNTLVKDLGGIRYVATPNNAMAMQTMYMQSMTVALEKLSQDDLKKLVAEKQKPETAQKSELGDEYSQIPPEIVAAFASGMMPSSSAMDYILSILPTSNY